MARTAEVVIVTAPLQRYGFGMNHDFDFLFGRWKIRNRRLKEALAGCSEWAEFPSTGDVRPVWGGVAHVDEYQAPETPWGPIYGLTVRLYDEKSGQWSIYWANRNKGRFDPPMTGAWSGQRGEFYDQEEFRGRMIYVRFIWSRPAADRGRWEQAFSDDGGGTWETNWVMELERATRE
jgi:hypothetical protein